MCSPRIANLDRLPTGRLPHARATMPGTRSTAASGEIMTSGAHHTGQAAPHTGRVELTDTAAIADSPYTNPELAPVPIKNRRWTTYNYCALWVGMAHNIPSYLLASGLILLGMDW